MMAASTAAGYTLRVAGRVVSPQSLDDDARAILAIEAELVAARDVDALTRHWLQDIVWFDFGPPAIDGLEAARARLARQFAAAGSISAAILRLDLNVAEAMGFAASIQKLESAAPDGTPLLDAMFRQTDCFVRHDDGWKLAHQHISLPVSLRSRTAVMLWE
jgi:ketosteroid isomerase-like protein